jgi:hypothetical protein
VAFDSAEPAGGAGRVPPLAHQGGVKGRGAGSRASTPYRFRWRYRPGGGPGGPRITNPLRFAMGARRAMSGGGPSWGGGRSRAGAGWPTPLMNPSNCIGAKPTSARTGWGPPPMKVCGTPLGQLFVGLRPVASDAIEVTLDMHSTGKPPQRHAGTQMSPVHIGLTADLIAQSDLKQVNAAQPHCPFDAGIVGKSV